MSRRPGLGLRWVQRFATDVYPADFVLVNGRKCRPPRYYDDVVKRLDLESVSFEVSFDEVEHSRYLRSLEREPFSYEKAAVSGVVKAAQVRNLKRTIE